MGQYGRSVGGLPHTPPSRSTGRLQRRPGFVVPHAVRSPDHLGTRKNPASCAGSGAAASASSRGSDGRRRPPGAAEGRGERLSCRRTPAVDGQHLVGVMKDVGELTRKQLFFFRCQREAREQRDALDILLSKGHGVYYSMPALSHPAAGGTAPGIRAVVARSSGRWTRSSGRLKRRLCRLARWSASSRRMPA